jgi:hypothetical protein
MNRMVNNMPVTPNSGGSGSRGGWLGKLFGMVNARSYEMLQRDRFQWQQGVITDEMGKRAVNAAAAKAAGQHVGDKLSANLAISTVKKWDKTLEKKDKDGNYVYTHARRMGIPENPIRGTYGSRSDVQAQWAKEDIEAAKAKRTPTTPPSGVTPPTVNNISTAPTNRNEGLDPWGGASAPNPQTPAGPDTANLQEPAAKTPKVRKPRAPRTPKAGA